MPKSGNVCGRHYTNNNGEGVKYPEHQLSAHNSPSTRPVTAEPEEIHIPAANQEDRQEDQLKVLASLIPSITNQPFPTLALIMATQTVMTQTYFSLSFSLFPFLLLHDVN